MYFKVAPRHCGSHGGPGRLSQPPYSQRCVFLWSCIIRSNLSPMTKRQRYLSDNCLARERTESMLSRGPSQLLVTYCCEECVRLCAALTRSLRNCYFNLGWQLQHRVFIWHSNESSLDGLPNNRDGPFHGPYVRREGRSPSYTLPQCH